MICSWKLWCDTGGQAVNSFSHGSCKCSLHSHWAGSRLLVSGLLSMPGLHWNSSWLACCFPVLWKSCRFWSAGKVFSCISADHRWIMYMTQQTLKDYIHQTSSSNKNVSLSFLEVWGGLVLVPLMCNTGKAIKSRNLKHIFYQ